MKECIKCKELKELKEFSIFNYINNNICKICKNKYAKQYYDLRREEKRKRDNKYYHDNKDKIKEKRKIYDLKNPTRQKEYNKINLKKNNLNQKNRWEKDINYKLRKTLSSRFCLELKKKSHKKDQSSLLLIGCTIEELKLYLEKQFKPEMTWENHGEIWEIDHIKPCMSFDLTDIKQQQECFHYTNLQPLFKTTEIAISFGYTDQIGNRNKYKN